MYLSMNDVPRRWTTPEMSTIPNHAGTNSSSRRTGRNIVSVTGSDCLMAIGMRNVSLSFIRLLRRGFVKTMLTELGVASLSTMESTGYMTIGCIPAVLLAPPV